MEKVKKQNWFSNFIKAFISSGDVMSDGRVDETKLSIEDKNLLAQMRKMDGVDKLEDKNIRNRYAAEVDSKKANKVAAGKVKGEVEEKVKE